MKELIKQIYPIFKQLKVIKELLKYLLIMFIIISYYFFIYKYILNINNEEIANYITTVEKLKPIEVPNIWYKSIIDDFFNKFTSKGNTIDNKFFQMQVSTKPLIKEYNKFIIKGSILDNIKYDHINNLVSECESYKNKIFFLEVQAYYTKMIHYNLIKDLNDILSDVNNIDYS